MIEIKVEDLEVWYQVGVPAEERAQPQRLLLTITMECDVAAAARSDDLADTVDYFSVSQRLLGYGQGRSWKLIEKLAADLAELILTEYGTEQVMVEVKKFPIPQARLVSVRLSRSRASLAGA